MKYIRDPIYSDFVELDPLSLKIISDPYFQRMRRIRQLGLAEYVYPGATHTRFSHMLGAFHLATKFLNEFKRKGEVISEYDFNTTRFAALLHDIGHISLSHVLEELILTFDHEEIGRVLIRERFAEVLGEELTQGILDILEGRCEPFKHQLIEGQMDVDRLDYLRRDAHYCGVDYGLVDIDRIVQSATLVKGQNGREFVITHKGMFAVEGYTIARYLMYWAVYYHKTNLGFQALIFSLFKRFRELLESGYEVWAPKQLISCMFAKEPGDVLSDLLYLDDNLILFTIGQWQEEKDDVLSDLSRRLLNRVRFKAIEVEGDFIEKLRTLEGICLRLDFDPRYYLIERTPKDVAYVMYDPKSEESIKVLMNERVFELSSILPTDTLKSLSREVSKRYVFVPEEVLRFYTSSS